MAKNLTNFCECGPRVKSFAEGVWKKYCNTTEFNSGRIVIQWQFPGRKPHVKQILEVDKTFDKTTKTLTTCYAGAKSGQYPLVRESLTEFRNGNKHVNIFYVNGNSVMKASGTPNSEAVMAVRRVSYGLNPDSFRI